MEPLATIEMHYTKIVMFLLNFYTQFVLLGGGGQSKLTLKRIYYKLWENWIETNVQTQIIHDN